jgi:hypothetical protein
VATYKKKYMFTEQGPNLTFWGPELCQDFEASKFIFIIDTGGHIKIKDEADMNEWGCPDFSGSEMSAVKPHWHKCAVLLHVTLK